MGARITRAERRWLEDRAARLRRMTAALDDDLDQVEQVEWSDSPNPSQVTLRAARDNRAEPDDLPTAPWC